MILEIALIVSVTAFSLMFMQELTGIFKKIVAIPGVVLLGPLLLASWIIEAYEDIWEWLAWTWQYEIQTMLAHIASVLPFQMGIMHKIKIVLLCIFAVISPMVIWGIERYKGRYTLPPIASYIGLVTWVIALFLLI